MNVTCVGERHGARQGGDMGSVTKPYEEVYSKDEMKQKVRCCMKGSGKRRRSKVGKAVQDAKFQGISAGESEDSVNCSTEVQTWSLEDGVPVRSNEKESNTHRLGCQGWRGALRKACGCLRSVYVHLDGLSSNILDKLDEIKNK